MARYDLVIRGGLIVDGARNPRYKGDVAIKDGRIARMGRVPRGQAEREIDAEGLVVAPGFIDLHTPYDAQVFWDPYLTTSGTNGVTSVVIGNCGFGFAPMREEHRERAMQSMTKVEAIPLATLEATMPWDWVTYPEMLDSIDRAPKAVNLLPYIGVNPMLIWVMGLEDAKSGRKPTAEETAQLKRLLHEAMDAGACGWSTQTLGTPGDPTAETAGGAAQSDYDGTPMPSDVMWPETLRALAEVLGERGEGFVEMSAAHLPREIWEELAEISGAPFIYQALPASDMMIDMNEDLFAWFERCREKGLRIYGQGITQNPPLVMTFDYWDLWGPVWTGFTGPEVPRAEKLANFADPAVREKLRAEPLKHMLIASIDQAKVSTVKSRENERFVGKTIGEIAQELGKHPVDAICDLVVSDELGDELRAAAIRHRPRRSQAAARQSLDHPGPLGRRCAPRVPRRRRLCDGADRRVRTRARDPEPRGGALAALGLARLLRGLPDRGVLREGAAADIVVYDCENLAYEFELRPRPAGRQYRVVSGGQGYRYVLVNGQVTIEDDERPTTTRVSCCAAGRGQADRASA
ncbi:MAG: amidohydrolase family protein [Myxococcota bacterium]